MAGSTKRRTASKRRREQERRKLASIDFSAMTREEFVVAVTCIALLKVRERGALGHKLGMETEERFHSAFQSADINLPYWFFGMRRADSVDDGRGIDAFAVTDIGEVPIQIKSSFSGKHGFDEKHPGHDITVLVVKKGFSIEKILDITVARVRSERWRRINRQPIEGAL